MKHGPRGFIFVEKDIMRWDSPGGFRYFLHGLHGGWWASYARTLQCISLVEREEPFEQAADRCLAHYLSRAAQ